MNVIEILVPFSFFAMLFGIAYLFLTTRNRERMALIEKGADASLFNTGRTSRSSLTVVTFALLSVGIGLGVLCGALLEKSGLDEGVAYPASIFIFAGIGLLSSYYINKSRSAKDELL